LKTGNVILAWTAQGGMRAVITDFGLAQLQSDAERPGGGTRDYMAPELVLGQPSTTASDI